MAVVDPKRYLADMDWRLRSKVRSLAWRLKWQTGMDLRIRDGIRTCQRQHQIYAQGRTAAGPVVTHAAGCQSWHVMGRAVDADPIDPARYRAALRAGASEDAAYKAAVESPGADCGAYGVAGRIWEQLGGVWGGKWTQFGPCGDMGHFEYHPGLKIESVCPNPQQCEAVVLAIRSVSPWLYVSLAAGAAALLGAAGLAKQKLEQSL